MDKKCGAPDREGNFWRLLDTLENVLHYETTVTSYERILHGL